MGVYIQENGGRRLVWPEFRNPSWPLSTPYMADCDSYGNRVICGIRLNLPYATLKGGVGLFEVAYATLNHASLNEACWGGVSIHGGCVRLLERRIRLLGLVWAFRIWFELWAYYKHSSRAHYSKLFSIEKIVPSLGPGILDFGRYKMGCLQLDLFFFFF